MREKFNKLPKSDRIVIIFLIVFLVPFSIVSIVGSIRGRQGIIRGEELNKRIQARLESIPPEGIQKAAFYPSISIRNRRIYPTDHTQEECIQLAYFLKALKRTQMRGMAQWEEYGYIDADAGAFGKLKITIGSKDSTGGQVIAIARISGEPYSYSLDFDAADVWNWLKER